MTEMGAYGLVASNGFSEAVTGKDMFGNKVSEERRKQGLIEATLSLVGAGAVAKRQTTALKHWPKRPAKTFRSPNRQKQLWCKRKQHP